MIDMQWNTAVEQQKESDNTKRDIERILLVMAAISGITAASVLVDKTRRKVKAWAKEENIEHFIDAVFLSRLSQEDLAKGFNFLSWISYGYPQGSMSSVYKDKISDKHALLAKIRRNVQSDNLDDYVSRPRHYEDLAGLKKREKKV